MQAEVRWKTARVRFELNERVLGDSLGLLQKRRRWTACDDWRLSVEKKKDRQRETGKREAEGEHVGE